ncbi:MAG: ABC transporter ATP-binding protein [Firmicutes bacterium]|nr:ABC transporter ATP-binding protein [Bacillota bacterium]MDH7496671.1 ABC transporter ATP-binding protein [Bacillota bacterium]
MIEVENLTKMYGRARGVEDLTFSVEQGEILGFLGPNGAGKTTTMRIIAGYLAATAGTVRVGGHDVFEEPMEARRRIGYLPENPPVYREMTVKGYLHFVSEIKGIPKSLRAGQIAHVVESCGLGPVYGRLIQNISRGFKQRVGLAQALLGEPDVLILDEPTVGLDPRQIIEIRELIRSLGGKHTVILSSHILPEVSMVCGRVVIINNGRLAAIDTPEGLGRRLRGSQCLAVRVRGPREAVVAEVGELSGVRSVSVEETGTGRGTESVPGRAGEVRLSVETEMSADVREALFFRMAERGWPIVEMRFVDLSLEDVFLRLTTEEKLEEASEVAASA